MSTDRDWTAAVATGASAAATAATLAGRATWVALRMLAVGVAIAVAFLADPDRRVRSRRWLLLSGNRWLIAASLVAVVFAGTFLLGLAGVVGVNQPSFVTTMFSGIISGLFSFVPIVVAVNQLTVSRVFGSPGELRAEIESVDELRTRFERLHPGEPVSPTEPGRFLAVVVEGITGRTAALDAAVADAAPEAVAAVERYLGVVRAQCADIDSRLGDRHHPLIDVLVPMMGDSYSRNLNDARRIRAAFGAELSPTAIDLLGDFEELFIELDVLRGYLKGIYIQQELSYLSRLVGYVGVGGFLTAMFVVMVFANGQPLSSHPVVLTALVSLAVAVATAPFAVLVSFVLRIATIAQRTAAPGAFTPLRETPEYAKHR